MQSKTPFPSKERRACITSIFSSVPLSASFVNVRFSLMHVHALGFFSTKTARAAPRLNASMPIAPLPLNRSMKNIKKSFFDAVCGGACVHTRHSLKVQSSCFSCDDSHFKFSLQSRSPRASPRIRSSAVAILVATGILYWSQRFTIAVMSGSFGSIITGL